MLLTIAAGHAALAGQDKKKPAEAPKEDSVVAYDSKTHGALQVKSVGAQPVDFFDVLQNGKRAFAGNPKLLNSTLELAPGAYVVDVNRTQRKVTIEVGKKTILWTGELVVEGKPAGAYWWPMQGKKRTLVSNPPVLNKARALFPGTYTVFVHVSVDTDNKNLGKAEGTAGRHDRAASSGTQSPSWPNMIRRGPQQAQLGPRPRRYGWLPLGKGVLSRSRYGLCSSRVVVALPRPK